MSQIPDNVVAKAAQRLQTTSSEHSSRGKIIDRDLIDDAKAKKISRKDAQKKYEEERITNERNFTVYQQLQKQGLLSGYTIHDRGFKKSCPTCLEHNGQPFEFNAESKAKHLPPFHPNCECEIIINWNNEQYEVFDIVTGEIKEGTTSEIVVSIINEYLEIQTDWKTVAMVSNFQKEYKTTDLAELVGKFSWANLSTLRVDNELREEFNKIEKALEPYKNSKSSVKMMEYYNAVSPDAEFDLKAHTEANNDVWGNKDSGHVKHPSYIFEGKLIRYDAPGNIVAGYAAEYLDIQPYNLSLGIFLINFFKKDDPIDAMYIEYGRRLYHRNNMVDPRYVA